MNPYCQLTKDEFGVLKKAKPVSIKVYLYLKLLPEDALIKHQEIASELDMTLRSVARAVAELRSMELISQPERFYRIPMQQNM